MRRHSILALLALATLLAVGSATPAIAAPEHASELVTNAATVHPDGAGVFQTLGDNVHISSTPPKTASAHGGWRKISGSGTKAKVTVWLQMKSSKHGKWHTVAKGQKTVKSGGGSGRRATARKVCHSSQTHLWRSVVDVDLIGIPDSPEKLYTKTVSKHCSA
jgi:hypothetical protein